MDARTPADERWDINKELWEQLFPEMHDPELVRDALQEMYANPAIMAKATRLEAYVDTKNPSRVDRAGHTSILYLNEMGVVGGMGDDARFVERPGAGFEFLKTVGEQVDLLKAIRLTRQRQIESFCHPERDQSPLGFRFIRKDGEKLGKDDVKEVRRLEEIVLNCGDESDPIERKRLGREHMAGFVRKYMNDTLRFDACPVEFQRNARGKLSGWYNVPADTVRLCTEEGYEGRDEICAVQVVNAIPHVAFSYEDLVYEVRNPRTDLDACGYGCAETEGIVKALTAYISGWDFNMSGMNRKSSPRGMLALFGKYSNREQNDFRRNMTAMMHGAGNAWTVPVVFAEDKSGGATWIPMDKFDEMLFARLFTLTASIACAHYGIHPTEVHFDSFSARTQSSLSGDDTAEKMAGSRDKGLIPNVKFLEAFYRQHVVPQLTSKYQFEFIGLQVEDQAKKHELLKLSSTIDELREATGRDPMKSKILGGAPSNPSLMTAYLAEIGQAQEQAAGGGDYPQDGGGRHLPYRDDPDGKAPEDDHMHTLSFGDEDDDTPAPKARRRSSKPMKKAELGGAPRARRVGRFSCVIERYDTPGEG